MSWYWIGLALVIPTVAGFAIALPFWWARHTMIGNVVGSGVILLGALLSIGREFQSLRAVREATLKTAMPGIRCPTSSRATPSTPASASRKSSCCSP